MTATHTTAYARISSLIENVYLAAVEPWRWPDFLEGLVAASGSRSARMLMLNDRADAVTSSLKVNIDDADHRAYVDHYVNTCPWRPELADKPGGRLYSTYLDFSCRQPDFYRTGFFNEWAGPQDIHHGICGTVYADATQTVQLLVQRTRGQGHYTREDTDAVNLLVPHLQRAIVLGRQVAHNEARTAAVQAAAGSRALPFLLLDASGRVAHVHPEAEALIAACGPLELRDRRLRVRRPTADARLGRLVRQAIVGSGAVWSGAGGTLTLEREDASPLGLLVTPVHPDSPGPWLGAARTFAAVFLYDPSSALDVDEATLAALYALTPAEARVAAGVAVGVEPVALAAKLGVSANTVRSQLKSVFRKTGAGRQTALARLILTGPACRRVVPGSPPPGPG